MKRSDFIRDCAAKIVMGYVHIGEEGAQYCADRALVEAAWRADGLVACGVLEYHIDPLMADLIDAARKRIEEHHK